MPGRDDKPEQGESRTMRVASIRLSTDKQMRYYTNRPAMSVAGLFVWLLD